MEVTMFLILAISFVLSLSLTIFIKQWLEIKDLKLQKTDSRKRCQNSKKYVSQSNFYFARSGR